MLRPSFLIGSLLIAGSSHLSAEILYKVTDLGPGSANAINNQGTVLANDGNNSQFLYRDGQKEYFPQPPNGTFTATALNDQGQIAGYVNFGEQYT